MGKDDESGPMDLSARKVGLGPDIQAYEVPLTRSGRCWTELVVPDELSATQCYDDQRRPKAACLPRAGAGGPMCSTLPVIRDLVVGMSDFTWPS